MTTTWHIKSEFSSQALLELGYEVDPGCEIELTLTLGEDLTKEQALELFLAIVPSVKRGRTIISKLEEDDARSSMSENRAEPKRTDHE